MGRRTDRAALPKVVAASQAFPGTYPPVIIAGPPFVDGGLWSDTNADVVKDATAILVIQPLAHRVGPSRLQREITATDAIVHAVFNPDGPAISAIDPPDPQQFLWPLAFAHGVRQAEALSAIARSIGVATSHD